MRILYFLLFLTFTAHAVQAQVPVYFSKNYLDARQKSVQDNKLNLIVFYHERSKSSAYNLQVVFNDPEVKEVINKNYHIAPANEADFDGKILMKRWELSRIPSLALIDQTGKLIAGANHGMTKEKLLEFLKFYSNSSNYTKPADFRDDSWATSVDSWKGYSGPDDAKIVEDKTSDSPNESTASKVNVAEPVAANEPEKPAKEVVDTKPTTPAPTTPTAKATPDVTNTATTIAESTKSTDAKNFKFLVQAGIFSAHTSATTLVDKINHEGGKAYIEEVKQPDKILYKVIAGKYYTEQEARDFIAKLATAGINSFIKTIE